MNNNFDDLAKELARSVTRRQALRRFGVGLAGMAPACFGLANKAKATTNSGYCVAINGTFYGNKNDWHLTGQCSAYSSSLGCVTTGSADCVIGVKVGSAKPDSCGLYISSSNKCAMAV